MGRQRSEREKARARERAREHYAKVKADPERYAELLERNRRWRKANPARAAAHSASWNERNPEGRRDAVLRSKYGIDGAEVEAMAEAQGGLCASCGERPVEHVDHCHETGRVRGLLCRGCNQAAGMIGDSPERAERLAAYLRRTS